MRTYYCNQINESLINKEVQVCGWVNKIRDHGGVIFIDLRDYTGITQIVFKVEISKESHVLADSIRGDFVLAVKGKVAWYLATNDFALFVKDGIF